MPTTANTQIDLALLAPPGIHGYLIVTDQTRQDPRSPIARMTDTTLRDFEVRGSLARYSPFQDDIQVSIENGQGESYFVIPSETEYLRVATPRGPFTIHKNSRDELATISYTCRASSWREAIAFFVEGITPFLDTLCYHSDAPAIIERIFCRDPANRLSVASYTSPYRRATVSPHEGELRRELLPIYALYREAANSSSNFYRFLCYYKILEGIYRHIRPALMARAKSQGITITTSRELVPSHPELMEASPSYIGQPIKHLFDSVLTPRYRDAVAHFALESGDLLNVSDYGETARFADIILLCRLCVREVVTTQQNYFVQFCENSGR